jgi:hypothetical protein
MNKEYKRLVKESWTKEKFRELLLILLLSFVLVFVVLLFSFIIFVSIQPYSRIKATVSATSDRYHSLLISDT